MTQNKEKWTINIHVFKEYVSLPPPPQNQKTKKKNNEQNKIVGNRKKGLMSMAPKLPTMELSIYIHIYKY